MLKLKLLGTPTIHLGDKAITLKTNKSQALLIYLAVNQGTYGRDSLADLLWSEMSNRQARKNLRDSLAQLRAVVGDYLLIEPNRLAFNRQLPCEIDVENFTIQVVRGRAIDNLSLMGSAFQLYQADFLAGFQLPKTQPFDQWALQKREELHSFTVTNMQWLATKHLQIGATTDGLHITERLLTLEPWQEAFHLLQMRLLAQAGNRVAALRQFEICQQILHDELALTPSPAAVALYEQIRDGIAAFSFAAVTSKNSSTVSAPVAQEQAKATSTTAPATSTTTIPHNLRRQLTPLVGRLDEISRIIELVTAGTPLITLIGESGIGKSRLALAIAEELCKQPATISSGRFNDGVWFVPLSDIVAAKIPKAVLRERIAARIGEAISFNFAGNSKLSSQLESYFHHRRLLLILDSFELFSAVTDYVLELLHRATNLQIIVTAHFTLGLKTEQIIEVHGLKLPTNLSKQEGENELLRNEAIAFFYARAHQIRFDFTLNQENVDAIIQICTIVAGSPLAIKLATALLDTHSCAEIATLLTQDYSVLHNEQLDLPLRQRSMQSVLDAVWQHLDSNQAQILMQCSLLQQVFGQEAAIAITATSAQQLQALVHQSWLRYDTKEKRFTMHDLLRQYAAKHLAAYPDQKQAAEQRHAEYYLDQLQKHERLMQYDRETIELLRLEWSNIRIAWAWALEQQRLDLLEKGVRGLANYYEICGLWYEGVQTLAAATEQIRQTLASTPQVSGQRLLGDLLAGAATLYFNLGRKKELQDVASEALALSQHLGEPKQQARALTSLARAAQLSGNFAAMLPLTQQALALLGQHVPWQQAQTRTVMGIAFWVTGDFAQGINNLNKAFEFLRLAPDVELEARINLALGLLYLRKKEYLPARRKLVAALQLADSFQSQRNRALAHLYLGDLWCNLGDYVRSAASYTQAAAILHIIGDAQWEGWLAASYGHFLQLQGDQTGAHNTFQKGLQLAKRAGLGQIELRILTLLGHLYAEQRGFDLAATCYEGAIALHQQVGTLHCIPDVYAGLALVHLAQNDLARAQQLAAETLALVAKLSINIAEEPAQVYLDCIAVLQAGNDPQAERLLNEAQRYLQEQASQLDDEADRHSYLFHVPANRKIIEATTVEQI